MVLVILFDKSLIKDFKTTRGAEITIIFFLKILLLKMKVLAFILIAIQCISAIPTSEKVQTKKLNKPIKKQTKMQVKKQKTPFIQQHKKEIIGSAVLLGALVLGAGRNGMLSKIITGDSSNINF